MSIFHNIFLNILGLPVVLLGIRSVTEEHNEPAVLQES